MKQIIIYSFLILANLSFAQTNRQQNSDPSRLLLEEKINNLQNDVSRLQDDIKQNENTSRAELAEVKTETSKSIESYKNETKDLINLYVFFISMGVIIIGFAINFFGKRTIKKRVEELIVETAQKHIEAKIVETLNSKITGELIENAIKNKSEEEINKILASIEHKGNTAIDQIKSKGDSVIKSMLASPPKFQLKIGNKHLSDKEIMLQNNTLRTDEFFNLAFNSKDPRIQIELYKNVIEIDPNNFHALNNMAVSHNNLNEMKISIELLNKAIKLNPKYYQAFANRAQAYNLLDKFVEALKDTETAISLEPKFEYAYAVKGNVLTKQGKFPEAEIVLNTAVEMNPNSAEAYYNRAFFYEKRKDYEKSQQDYAKAEALGFVNKAMLYNNMAVLFRRLKQFDKAIEFIEKAKAFNPNFANIDGTLALIYADKNDDENFYVNLKIALEKGCQAWNYLTDPGFDKYREEKRLKMLIEPYKKNYFS